MAYTTTPRYHVPVRPTPTPVTTSPPGVYHPAPTPGTYGSSGRGGRGTPTVVGTSPSPTGSTATSGPDNPNAGNALTVAMSAFPWLAQLGIPIEQIQAWVVEGLTGEALLGEVRKTPQYAAMFPNIRRPDGTMRMQESQYLSQQDSYRQLLHRYGDPNHDYTPAELAGFFGQDIDPNELHERLDLYDQVQRGGQDVKDAFYVYAGMRPTDDQLFRAVTDPSYAQTLVGEYNQRVTSQPLDYATWITRATEAGMSRVATSLQQLQQQGVAGEAAMTQIQQIDPNFARQMMDVLYHGGDPQGGNTLNLNELMHSFEYALIGGAATQSGLALPDRDRVEALRAAGVDRAKALQAYSDYSQSQNLLSGMATRTGRTGFTQDDYERAVLLHQGPAEGDLANISAQDKALSHATGSTQVQQDEYGRSVQRGLRAFGQ